MAVFILPNIYCDCKINKGFRIENLNCLGKAKATHAYIEIETYFSSSEHQDQVSADDVFSLPVIENPEHQTLWYSKYFLGKFHHNYVGQDNEKSPFVLSVVEEKSFGKSLCRCILWTKDGPKRLVIQGAQKTRSAKAILGQFGFNEHLNKEVSLLPLSLLT